jgi:hypothetical protein
MNNSDELVQGVPLATETGISLIILTPMKKLQGTLNRRTFFSFTFLTHRGKSASNFIAISSLVVKITNEMPGSVASGTPYKLRTSSMLHK